jgi:hypothetical protein
MLRSALFALFSLLPSGNKARKAIGKRQVFFEKMVRWMKEDKKPVWAAMEEFPIFSAMELSTLIVDNSMKKCAEVTIAYLSR